MIEVSLPHTEYALATYYITAPKEASANLARYDGVRFGNRIEGDDLIDTYAAPRGQGFGPEVKCCIMPGTYALVLRLLRCLLREGAEGTDADQAGLRRDLRTGGRDCGANVSNGRLRFSVQLHQ
ncbi:MAG: amidase family protein [Thermomicrobiales bacterium]|nr:amidase family protein [Thermomicrobiales bacterium]